MSSPFVSPVTWSDGAPLPQADGAWLVRLRGGELRCRMSREEIPLPEACGFATRHNAKRRFLFVSRLLGRHLPTRPAQLTDAARRLAEKLRGANLEEPCLFIGMAETATTLGQSVFREWRRLGGQQTLYLDSTRRRTGSEIAFAFSEAHSHATGHIIHRPLPAQDPHDFFRAARSLVIIDDETTTAQTAARLRSAYADWRQANGCSGEMQTYLAVLLRWHPPTVEEEADADALRCLSLLEGRFEFTPNSDALPVAPPQSAALDGITQARIGARGGIMEPESLPPAWAADEEAPGYPGEKILVLGTGEYGFVPLLFAEALAARGAETFVQATTRSPVLPGGAMGCVRRFPALSGEAHEEFLYNVPDDHPYSRVILLCEDRLPLPGHPVLDIPRIECKLAPR
jgi:hypothetical protein